MACLDNKKNPPKTKEGKKISRENKKGWASQHQRSVMENGFTVCAIDGLMRTIVKKIIKRGGVDGG